MHRLAVAFDLHLIGLHFGWTPSRIGLPQSVCLREYFRLLNLAACRLLRLGILRGRLNLLDLLYPLLDSCSNCSAVFSLVDMRSNRWRCVSVVAYEAITIPHRLIIGPATIGLQVLLPENFAFWRELSSMVRTVSTTRSLPLLVDHHCIGLVCLRLNSSGNLWISLIWFFLKIKLLQLLRLRVLHRHVSLLLIPLMLTTIYRGLLVS